MHNKHKKKAEKLREQELKSHFLFDTLSVRKKGITVGEFENICSKAEQSQLQRFASLTFSYLALDGFLIYLIIFIISQITIYIANTYIASSDTVSRISVYSSALSFALFAYPLFSLFVSHLPSIKPNKHNISFRSFILWFLALWGVTYIGNAIGIFNADAFNAFFRTQTVSPTNKLISYLSIPDIFICLIILPAISEELVFRKLIIDKSGYFGETSAALFSALFFALYHMNIYQFFYAFFAGYVLSLVYIKTGKIIYTILLHGMVNLLGSFLPLFVAHSENLTLIYSISVAAVAVIGLYVAAWRTCHLNSIKGTFFKYENNKNNKLAPPNSRNYAVSSVKSVILNPGMIIFIIFSLTNFVLYFIQ